MVKMTRRQALQSGAAAAVAAGAGLGFPSIVRAQAKEVVILASSDASYITGQTLNVCGGILPY